MQNVFKMREGSLKLTLTLSNNSTAKYTHTHTFLSFSLSLSLYFGLSFFFSFIFIFLQCGTYVRPTEAFCKSEELFLDPGQILVNFYTLEQNHNFVVLRNDSDNICQFWSLYFDPLLECKCKFHMGIR